jgi:isoleucyl-tRNA synthetase
MAPFVPFLTEKIFLQMQDDHNYSKDIKSVHLMDFPKSSEELIDEKLQEEMDFIGVLVQELRALREQVKIKIRQPIKEFLFSLDETQKKNVKKFESLIKSELKVKELNFIDKKKARSLYTEELVLSKGNIGKDFKKDRQKVEQYLESLSLEEINDRMSKGKLKFEVDDNEYEITKEHFKIEQHAKKPFAVKVLNFGTILINSELDNELLQEGFANDFSRNINEIRKQLSLTRGKEKLIINIQDDIDIEKSLGDFRDIVMEETGIIKFAKEKKGKEISFKIQGKKIDVRVEEVKP